MKQFLSLFIATIFSLNSFSQLSSKITTWKNNSKSAYTFTHDDFGLANVNGIENYADTIAFNRDIRIAFGAVPGQCDENDWLISKRLLSHGHEIMNHTWNHKCGNPAAGAWCTAYGVWDEDDFDVELVDAHNSIKTGSGAAPRFFIYPFDQYITSMNTYLVDSLNYIGTRTGPYDNGLNSANISDPAYPGFYITRPPSGETSITVEEYNSIFTTIDQTISTEGWGLREFHGVQDGSWGTLTAQQYRNVCDYMKQKVDAGDLWVGTPSEVITYIKQRQLYTTNATFNNNKITVTFNTPSFDFNKYFDDKKFTSPVTIEINTANHPGDYKVYQNGVENTDFKKVGTKYYINAYPIDGNIELSNGCTICISNQPTSITTNEGDNSSLSVTASSDNPITYQWFKGTTLLNGETSSSLNFTDLQTSDAGQYSVKLTSNGTSVTSSSATVTVFQSTNCGAPICITYQPSNKFVTENQSYVDYVTAEGSNLTYQWYKNDVSINFTQPTFSITNTSFLNSGTYKVKISDGVNTVWTNPFNVTIQQSSTQQPYNNSRHNIPGTIEAELYDNGAAGIAYHDNTPGQEVSNDLRTTGDVEVENYGWQKYNLGYTQEGEWVDYSVAVLYDGVYTISAMNSSAKSTGKVSMYFDDSLIIDQIPLPNTFGWHDYRSTNLGQVALTSGWHTLHLYIAGDDANIDNITFVAETITKISDREKNNNANYIVNPNPIQNNFQISAPTNESVELNLINTSGQTVYSTLNTTNSTINIEHLESGIYILQVSSGKNISTHRIIKK